MPEAELNYQQDLPINQDRLDKEWAKQPGLFLQYSRAWNKAKAELRQAEENVKLIRSELVVEANGKLAKPTGPNVEAYYRTHQRHIDAKEEWLEAFEKAELLETSKWAFQQRKEALENLVKLIGQQYFSTPRASGEDGQTGAKEVQNQGEKDRAKVVTRRRRTPPA